MSTLLLILLFSVPSHVRKKKTQIKKIITMEKITATTQEAKL